MANSILANVRNKNFNELDSFYKQELNSYTNLYQEYLEKTSGNEDDRLAAEKDLKPKIIEKNNSLINLAKKFLENNEESLKLIESDYEMIEKKTKELKDLELRYQNLEVKSFDGNQADEIKGQKRIENISLSAKRNSILLIVLTVVNLILLAFLIFGISKILVSQE